MDPTGPSIKEVGGAGRAAAFPPRPDRRWWAVVSFMHSGEARLRLTKIHLRKLTLGLSPCLELAAPGAAELLKGVRAG